MTEQKNSFDKNLCTDCGICVSVCSNMLIEKNSSGKVGFKDCVSRHCLACGQCMAICPAQAIFAAGLSYEKDFAPMPTDIADAAAFANMLSTRRSVRSFTDEPVSDQDLAYIFEQVQKAPIGAPPNMYQVEATVVSERATLDRALPLMIDLYEKFIKLASNPIVRFFMKLKMTAEEKTTVFDFVLPLMKSVLPESKQNGLDPLMWGAPVLILFHAPKSAMGHTEDIHIANTYAFLAAHARGLGATVLGVVPPAVEMNAKLREMFNIPVDHKVISSIIAGHPEHRYQRTIRRRLLKVNRV